MPRRVTMLLRNSRLRVLLAGIFLFNLAIFRVATPAQDAASPQAQPAAPSQQSNSSSTQGQAPADNDSGVFVFKKEVEEVVLHASVVDNKDHMVLDLGRDAFSVFENDKPQAITSFRREDVPVAMGIVIDNSGS